MSSRTIGIFLLVNFVNCQLFPFTNPENFGLVKSFVNSKYGNDLRNLNCLMAPRVTLDAISLFLHTSDRNDSSLVNWNPERLNSNASTVFITQGWLESLQTSQWPLEMVQNYLTLNPNANVIHMDWSNFTRIQYTMSVCTVLQVGKIVGSYIANLINDLGFNPRDIHYIGFSLGAQIAGIAGNTVKQLTGGRRIGKITALDAAGPAFDLPLIQPDENRITPDDADDVIGVHTNTGFAGTPRRIGRLDFYVNGGKEQEGCKRNGPLLFRVVDIIYSIFCSHLTAPFILNQILLGSEFPSYYCPELDLDECDTNQTLVLKLDVPKNATGTYYVPTDVHFEEEKKKLK